MSYWKTDALRAAFCVVGCLIFVGCKKDHSEAKVVKRTAPELNLPGMSVEEKKVADDSLEWNMQQLVDAYDKIGLRNPKWDGPVHDLLTFLAQVRAYGLDIEGYPHLLQYHSRRAVEAGCNDPLVRYLYVRFRPTTDLSQAQLMKDYGEAADMLAGSQYHSVWKFYSSHRAYQRYDNQRTQNDEIVNLAAKHRADGLTYGLDYLQNERPPLPELDAVCDDMLDLLEHWGDDKDWFDRMEGVLMKRWPKEGFVYVARARFYNYWAWKGRTHKLANEVTPEQWKLFSERLAQEESIINQGLELAPKDGRLPTLMIQVASAQQKGLDEMRRWFDRAMTVDTNNLAACKDLLNFLLPRWFGSREAMLQLGRECVASKKWGGEVPLALVEAHWSYNRYDGAPDGSYWRLPDVWPDIKASYERFFELNPRARRYRSYYARYAWWCGQREALKAQLDILGDDVDPDAFNGSEDLAKAIEFANSGSK